MKGGLEGKSIIVTGGASGIGRAAVMLLAEAGCDVTIADINDSGGEEAASTARGLGGRTQFVHTDISQENDIRRMVEHAVARFGRLNGAINGAGINPSGLTIDELSIEEWDRRTGINLRGAFICLKYQLPALRATGGGSLVAISSGYSVKEGARAADYCASKAGINSLYRSAALENARAGIRLNLIVPGATDTPMFRASVAANPIMAAIAEREPFGRIGKPEEVAAGAVWLLSDYASFVTGSLLFVDGGLILT